MKVSLAKVESVYGVDVKESSVLRAKHVLAIHKGLNALELGLKRIPTWVVVKREVLSLEVCLSIQILEEEICLEALSRMRLSPI